MVARVPVGAYAPGQTINVELAVRNRSDVLIAAFTVQLIKVSKRLFVNGVAHILSFVL